MSSDSEADEAQKEAFCEVCGSNQQRMVMVLCACYSQHHLVGCHTFCMAGDRWRRAGIVQDYYCHFCAEYRKQAQHAIGDFKDQQRRQTLAKRGRPTEEELEGMPALPQLGTANALAPHAAAAEPLPTAQMRIDAAAKAAAAAEAAGITPASPKAAKPAAADDDDDDDDDDGDDGDDVAVARKQIRQVAPRGAAGAGGGAAAAGADRKRPRLDPAAAAAAGGAGGGRGAGLNQKGAGRSDLFGAAGAPAPAAAPAAQPARLPGIARKAANPVTKTFVTGLNKNQPAAVRAAAAKAHDQAAQRREAAAAAAVAAAMQAGAAPAASGQRSQQSHRQQQQRQQQGPLRQQQQQPEYTVNIGPVHIQAQVVRTGIQPTDDEAELNMHLDLSGHLKRSFEIQKYASEGQIAVMNNELLVELSDTGGADRKQFIGGVFDLDLHPTILRFADDAELGYRPIILEPTQPARLQIKEQLYARDRFVVAGLKNRLLAFLPTPTGELQLLLPIHAEDTDELAAEVVQSILRDPNLGGAAAQQHGQPPSPPLPAQQQQQQPEKSDEADCAAHDRDDDDDDKDQVMEEVQQRLQGAAAALQQQQQQHMNLNGHADHQQQQHEEEGDMNRSLELDAQGSFVAHPMPAAAAAAAAASRRPVQHLPQGMTAHYQQQQQQQQRSQAQQAMQRPDHQLPSVHEQLLLPLGQLQQQQQQHRQPGSAATASGHGAAAASCGRSGSGSSRVLAILEAVQGSSVAQLLRSSSSSSAGWLCGKKIMPQMQDMAPVSQLRLYMVGFASDDLQLDAALFKLISAAINLGLRINSQPNALQQLCSDLGLPSTAAAAAGSRLRSPYSSRPTSPISHVSYHTTAAAAASPAAADAAETVDLTQDDPATAECCRHVLLLPQHTTAAALQGLIDPVPLWRLLAAPVCVVAHGSGQGLLQYLFWLDQQQQRGPAQSPGQQQQQQQNGLPAGEKQQSQPEDGEIVDHDESDHDLIVQGSDHHPSDRLPSDLSCFQWYVRGLAVVTNAATLKSSSQAQVRQLLSLLQLCQQQQRQWWQQQQQLALSVMPFSWQLVISRDDLDSMADSADRWQLLKPEIGIGRVQVLEDVLAPDTVAEDSESPPTLVANALTLAAQQQQSLRLVILAVPNIDRDLNKQHSGSSAQSSPVEPLPAAAAAAAQGRTPGEKQPCMDPSYKSEGKRNLEAANKEGRIIAGTLNQVLQLLEQIAGTTGDDQ